MICYPDTGNFAHLRLMRIIAENELEATLLEDRLPALAYAVGLMVQLHAELPSGKKLTTPLQGSPAAHCANLNERMEDFLSRHGA